MVYYTGDGVRFAEQPGETTLHIDLHRRAAKCTVSPGAESGVGYGCLIPLLSEALAQVGHHIVHAAMVAVDDRAILLAGRPGAGKTTASLALAGAGMQMLTDDASVLTLPEEGGGDRVMGWGLPRALKVHEQSLAMLPWLEGVPRHPCVSDGEYIVELAAVSDVDPRLEWRIALVLLVEGPSSDGHRLREVGKVAAVSRLTQENIRALDARAEGSAGRGFEILSKMVAVCPTYSLSAGAELGNLADIIKPLLAE
jgi:hypothetical protein